MFKLEGGLYESPREVHNLVSALVGPDEAREFWKKFYDNYITKDDIDFMKKAGFNSVRIPFSYRLLTPEDQPGVWLEPGFELLDRVIRWSKEDGLYVILDMHCAPGGQTGANIDDSWGYPWLYESPEAQQRVALVWRRIAERYRSEPAVLGYDLMNEPLPDRPEFRKYHTMLEPILKRITAAIRQVDPNHVVILEGSNWDTSFGDFGPPFDSKAVYSFHKYWSPTTQASIREYLDYRDKYNVPLWLGESGENTDEWVGQMVELAERNQIGWSFWPYKKIDSPRGVVSFDPPVYWDEILKFARICGGVETDTWRKARLALPLDHCRAALNDIIVKSQFRNCKVNASFLRALHLRPA
jgi:endoglucanase